MLDGTDEKQEAVAAEDRRAAGPAREPEVVLVGHSSLFYWWPVWVASIAIGLYSMQAGEQVRLEDADPERLLADNTVGLAFVTLLLVVILFTNVKLRGLASVALMLSVALGGLALAYFDLWQDVVNVLPDVSVHMDAGFYLLFGGCLFVLWFLQFFLFDRLVYYRIRPGQMVEEHVIGGGEVSYESQGMQFEQKDKDFVRHILLGFGTGDLVLLTGGGRKATISVPNVLFCESRVREIQRLLNVRPDHI